MFQITGGLIAVLLLAGCATAKPGEDALSLCPSDAKKVQLTFNFEQEKKSLTQQIETPLFKFNIPGEWTSDYNDEDVGGKFIDNGKEAGSLQITDYPKDESTPIYIPNHATAESCAVVRSSPPKMRYVYFINELPAGAVEQDISNSYQYIVYDQSRPDWNVSYVFTFSEKVVSRGKARAIADTFEFNK